MRIVVAQRQRIVIGLSYSSADRKKNILWCQMLGVFDYELTTQPLLGSGLE